MTEIQEARREREDEARALARSLTGFANGCCPEEHGAFLDKLRKEHRTLQQGVTRLFVAWLEMLAETKDDRFDLRNEASVILARKFVERLDEGERHLPLV